ncbi:MBL fold metallo-hydrolase RNA specificity domain-containing protein [Pseudomonas typographi]|uniref:MBL fold metallo-hydrolase RNA specificity domain-containing protein n=1 Tax=Pseudomonas typographi TaxID=2715964 RepID=UPI0016847C99|nr:MBL fold metallo-hydrolase [Pseudomonas typographi]MBD1552768.1 MBL fold metallo-hydrolase [Pseudomonas typographi]
MPLPRITHHGAVAGVTGSCHELHLPNGQSLLIDCGSFQGQDAEADGGLQVGVDRVAALVVTHVHIDHVGRIPALLAAGFRGPILCSEPSAKLLPLILEDAFRLAISRETHHVARYLRRLAAQIVAVPYGHWHSLPGSDGVRLRLQRAGHVLGSAYVECDVPAAGGDPHRVVFSGDLGPGDSPLLLGPHPPERADVLVLESTYGDRNHGGREHRQQRLEAVIDLALQDHGTLLIPAFTLGRTQDLLHDLGHILERKALVGQGGDADSPVAWPQLPVILDSPLASRITQAYQELSHYWNEAAQKGNQLQFPQLITVNRHEQHQTVVNYLASTLRPAIVIAGNGMCSSGRIVNYLKKMLRQPRHNLLFTGYQAKGTPGAVLKAAEGAEGFVAVELDGERYDVNARVHSVAGYSAHADQRGLVAFATGMGVAPRQVLLVHGDGAAKAALAERLGDALGSEVLIP